MITETIVLAPGANKTELLRSLALFGKGSFGMRIFTTAHSLAEEVLIRKGMPASNVIPDAETPYLISRILKTIDAFKNSSFTDAENMAGSIKTLRNLITDDEETQMNRLVTESAFADKNKGLLAVYKSYRKSLGDRKDSIDVIRKALKENYDFNVEFVRLTEFPLTPLEQALIDKISAGKVIQLSLADLFEVEKQKIHDIRYVKAYGNSNEVENVLNYIFEKDIPLDDCVVAVTDSRKYGQLLEEYSQKYDLNMTFARGVSINNTNPARLLRMYHQWDKEGYHGVDPLMDMLYCSSFNMDKLKEMIGKDVSYNVLNNSVDRAGQLKLEPESEKNKEKVEKYIPLINERDRVDADVMKVLAEELGKDCRSFLKEYSVINDGKDQEAVSKIIEGISSYLKYNPDASYEDVFKSVLSSTVGKTVSREGSLTVTDIKGALSVCRKHLFIIGLSAVNFPGNVRENYLLLDDDLKLYGNDVPVSTSIIERKKEELFSLLRLNSALNTEITVSFSGYDFTGIKDENASSVLFEIYTEEVAEGTMEAFEKILENSETSYLQNKLSLSEQVLNSLKTGESLHEIPKGDIAVEPYDGIRSFSPSALEIFFQCPKRFYLASLLGIEEPDPDDPFEVINARDMGTLVHSAMEYLAGNPGISRDDFLGYSSGLFDDYLKTRTAINPESVESGKKEFMNMIENGFKNDPKNEVMAAEEKITVYHKGTGIGIYGYPDRVEKDKDGKFLIADFKTGRKVKHQRDDIDSCLQVVLYAYMMSHRKENKLPVSYCTYRYLRFREPVLCKYDGEMEQMLDDKLKQVKEALDTGYFPCAEDEKSCTYCKMAAICGKKQKSEVSDDE